MIKDLPQKLKELRISNHLSQKEVAAKLGMSPSIISGYETGERTPSTEILLSLSYLYKCSTDYLLGRTNKKPEIVLDTTGLSDEQIFLVQALIENMKKGRDS